MANPGMERRKFIMDKLFNETFTVNPDYLYRPLLGDVIVVGSPKSGTTWMQQICHQIRAKGDDTFDDIHSVTTYINNPAWQLYDANVKQPLSPRIFKHHEPYGFIKTPTEQKHIVITRHPYDTTLSNKKFMDRWYGGDNDVSDEEMAKLTKEMHENKKLSHIQVLTTWWPHRTDTNTMLVFYEDAVADLKSFVKIIAEFMEISLIAEDLEEIAKFCSFEWMSKNEHKFRNSGMAEKRAIAAGLGTWQPNASCVRKDGGRAGQGSNCLSPELKAVVDEIWGDTMFKLYGIESYEKLYEQYGRFRCG